MTELHTSLGLIGDPFSHFSAEEEINYLKNIYINPKYYNSLRANLKNGSSRFIVGSRGSGKTALILSLFDTLSSDDTICIMFDAFDSVPKKDNEKHFIYQTIQKIIVQYCLCLEKHPHLLKKLDKFDKEKLAFFIEQFFKTISRREYENRVNRITKFKRINFIKQIWNYFFNKPINFLISGGVEILSDTVAKSLGLLKINSEDFFKNNLPSAELKNPKATSTLEDYDYQSLKEILSDLCLLIKKSGYKNVVVFFDKIDEFRTLNGAINDIATFIEPIVKDTQLLMNNNFSFVFSVWDEVKDALNSRGVRFDKFQPIDVSWSKEDLKSIIDKRVKYFSNNSKNTSDLLEKSHLLDEIISLSFRSPRDMLLIFSKIYQEQDNANSSSNVLTEESVKSGKLKFCKDYDYYSVYPSKRGSKADVTTNINRLLRIKKKVLKTNDFVSIAKMSTPTAISYIGILKNFNFIKELAEKDGNAPQYEVIDPKISHLIDSNVDEI